MVRLRYIVISTILLLSQLSHAGIFTKKKKKGAEPDYENIYVGHVDGYNTD